MRIRTGPRIGYRKRKASGTVRDLVGDLSFTTTVQTMVKPITCNLEYLYPNKQAEKKVINSSEVYACK